ncbi:MAG: hypothetical protein CMJ58_06460 [Planctomycetaceae bacterium]|nr:hypothetical protein [Planctomycetaceae bacterium]
MFWPLILPLQITSALLIAFVALAVANAPRWKRTRRAMFFGSTAIAILGFLPLCFVVAWVVDSFRFGESHYAQASRVDDKRVGYYLPPTATEITLLTRGNGYHARYRISRDELTEFLDAAWANADDANPDDREQLANSGREIDQRQFAHWFEAVEWPLPPRAVCLYGPIEPDGGGAIYYFDPAAGVVFQSTGYW